MRVFVTGSSGFIGFHLCRRLLEGGATVAGFDGMTPYYDPALKRQRRALLEAHAGFVQTEAMLEDAPALARALAEARPDVVVHLAAQAGVRYSIEAPLSYVDANLIGTFNLLEAARAAGARHVLIASTSSVYGANPDLPYRETDRADWPVSFYAATKKATEAMSHALAHIHALPVTVFRFFTVYGPWGRPDMALFRFTEAILQGRPIEVYNGGEMWRDFTHVDDLVRAIGLLIDRPPPGPEGRGDPVPGDSLSPVAPWRVVNIGNSAPVRLSDFIDILEAELGRPAERLMRPMQPGDVPRTWADCSLLGHLTGFCPATDLRAGVTDFVRWYRGWNGV